VGAVMSHAGTDALIWNGLKKIILSLIISPIVGTIFGFLFMIAIFWLFRKKNPHTLNRNFRYLQILSASFMAFSHGTADAQKTMGIITMALVSYGTMSTFDVPTWVKAASALSMALGTAAGGWRIIKTLGKDFVKLQPVHGFAAETSSAVVILGAASLGMPVSTTHVITSSIMGVGLSKRVSAVNWIVARRIVTAWFITIPMSGLVASIIYILVSQFLPS
jgi:PiT family inorganic phosphate transporter